MFGKARLKLTAWYLLIISLISLGFSLVIYKVLTAELDRFARLQRLRLEQRFRGGEFLPPRISFDPELAEETKRRLIFTLVFVNGGIFFIAGGLAYFLAGKTLQPIKKMVEEQNQFITDASHELKTPLTSLRAALEVNLRDKSLTLEAIKTLIKESLEEVNKLQSLTEGLFRLAQEPSINHQRQLERISLSDLIKHSIQEIKPQARKKKIVIKDQTQNFEFKGDLAELVDLLVILLDNAVKYSPAGRSVGISSKKTDSFLSISVSDQGIGIAAKDLPHIFDRFYRADLARGKDGAGGYGLGLAIAKKIVEGYQGTMTVKSQLGKGSIFTVRLPVKYPVFQDHCL